jgi:hypothetical protein
MKNVTTLIEAASVSPLVQHSIMSGRSHEDIIVDLVNINSYLVGQLIDRERAQSKKIIAPDGSTMVFHLPDEFVPVTHDLRERETGSSNHQPSTISP